MGYDLHITRSTDWAENQGCEIAAAEWLALVEADPELVADPKSGPYSVRWSSTFFDWFEGNVFTTDPDRATVSKLLGLAQQLAGVVQGDDGELYDNARQWPRGSLGTRAR